MNKKDLIAALAERNQCTKKDAEAALNALCEVIVETVSGGDKVQLIGFGTFEAHNRKERTVTNPQTREQFTAPATVVPVFKAGQSFKQSVLDAHAAKKAAEEAATKTTEEPDVKAPAKRSRKK